ncbi:MAG: PP0621 family protein [Campylobacterales bacterium]|nr:PP0621 family protein [Campylobacterales bacterium]
MKFLLFIGFIVGIYYVFFAKKKSLKAPENDLSLEEAMIPCATCGTYVQAKEALMSGGKYYCCSECLTNKDKK